MDEVEAAMKLLGVKDFRPLDYIKTDEDLRAFVEAVRNDALEEAAKACEAEEVDYLATGSREDRAYNTAIEHAATAIRALAAKEPAP